MNIQTTFTAVGSFLPRISALQPILLTLCLWEAGGSLSRAASSKAGLHSQPWPGQSSETSPGLQWTSALGLLLAWFLASPCLLLNYSALQLEERRRENSLTSTSEVLLCFFFLPPCCWPISGLHLSTRQTKKTREKFKQLLSMLHKWSAELHLTTDQVFPARIFLPDRPLQRIW